MDFVVGETVKGRFENMVGNRKISKSDEKHMIAWIEKEVYSDADELVREFRRLAENIGFRITGIRREEPPFYGGRSEIVKFYTDTFSEVPQAEARKADEWLGKVFDLTGDVIDADLRVSGSNINEKTRLLKEVKKV